MKRAVRDAAKLAYLVRLIEFGINEVSHYAKEADTALADILIENQTINIKRSTRSPSSTVTS